LRLRAPICLALRNADCEADRLPPVRDQFAVSFLSSDVDGVRAAKELGQVDLKTANGANCSTRNGGRLLVGENDGLVGADPAARGTAFLAAVLILNHNAVLLIHAVHAKQTEIYALHAIGAAAIVDDWIPAPRRLFQQFFGRRLGRIRAEVQT